MKIWQIVVPGLLGLALAGCRSDPEVAYLQRDNLNKQRKIEQLQNRVEDLEEALNATAPSGPVIMHGAPPGELLPGPGAPSTRPALPSTSPGRTYSEPDAPPPGGLNISPGMEVPPGEIPDRMKVPGSIAPERQTLPPGGSPPGGSRWNPAGDQPLTMGTWRPGASAPAANISVAQITLHPALTGGIGSGGRLGDEGLLVVVEPRDFAGNIVAAPGTIAVALLDPALSGAQARLGRWDFAAAETQGMIHTGSQPGIHLRLPWTATPVHDRLKVFARYTTSDGRRLQAEQVISVALNGPPPARPETLPDADPARTASRPQRPQWSPVR
jgi:hypothetical protein